MKPSIFKSTMVFLPVVVLMSLLIAQRQRLHSARLEHALGEQP